MNLDADVKKLKEFSRQLYYRHVGQVIIGFNRRKLLIRELRWIKTSIGS